MSIWTKLRFCFVLPTIVFTALGVQGQENYSADGIRVYGNTVVIFARLHLCNGPTAVRLLASTDNGKTWAKPGALLEGSEFTSSLVSDGRLWIAGLHTAEGPGIDPFLLIPAHNPLQWKLGRIYEGPSELIAVAMGVNGELSAWVSHIDMSTEDWTGPVYLHASSDGGKTWNVIQQQQKVLSSSQREFQEIQKQDRGWRVVDLEDGGFGIQHQGAELSEWDTVARFPMERCKD